MAKRVRPHYEKAKTKEIGYGKGIPWSKLDWLGEFGGLERVRSHYNKELKEEFDNNQYRTGEWTLEVGYFYPLCVPLNCKLCFSLSLNCMSNRMI